MKTFEARVELRDGVELATDVYLPEGGQPRPALIQRTPYGKDVPLIVSLTFEPGQAVDRGYAVVVQDCRGCGRSDGQFHALVNERRDGHDTIEWVASQEWCDGRVGVYGSSYMGATALQAAVDAPAALRAATAYITGPNYHDGWVYTGGAFELGMGLRWSLEMAERIANWRNGPNSDDVRLLVSHFREDPVAYCESSHNLRELTGIAELPHWREWHDHQEYDDYWQDLDIVAAARQGQLGVPLLQVAAWYDLFCSGQLALHGALQNEHKLIIGPWDHNAYLAAETRTRAGARDFGRNAVSGSAGVGPVVLDWFDGWLRGGADGLPPVRYYAIGPDEWREAAEWPPPSRDQRWFLRSHGRLTADRPGDEPAEVISYDPGLPTLAVGGRHVLGYVTSGVQDQRKLAGGSNVVAYRSEPLATALPVVGSVQLELYLEPTASSTDVVAMLLDITPSGEALNVAEGNLRTDGHGGLVTLDLGGAAYEFGKDHLIGLNLMSSWFPRFDRLPNPTTQWVLHDSEHPSTLVLPVQD